MDEADLDELSARIAALDRPLLLALDVDGTLAPIVDDPSRAAVPDEVARTLERIERPGIVIALVTGRDPLQLASMIEMPSAWRVTEHGREIWAPGEETSDAPPITAKARDRLARFAEWARRLGAHIETKTASVVVHVRELASHDPAKAAAALEEARRRALAEGFSVREGRAVVEVSLEEADKGRALQKLADRIGAASVVYAGDDLTDYPAIRVASERGLGIFVRSAERPDPPPGTSAVVDGPEAIAELLARLERRL